MFGATDDFVLHGPAPLDEAGAVGGITDVNCCAMRVLLRITRKIIQKDEDKLL